MAADLAPRSSLPKWLRFADPLLALAVTLSFFGIILILVFSNGVGCADDSFFAMVAKNLALSGQYGSTLQPDSAFRWVEHDPLIGTGPGLLIPAALFIRLFGNTYWAPGLCQWSVCLALVLAIGWQLKGRTHAFGLSIMAGGFLGLIFFVFPYHMEQWYALLGEIPACLCILLGLLLLTKDHASLGLAGLFFGLSLQIKLISGIAITIIIAAWAFEMRFVSDQKGKIFINKFLVLVLAIAGPTCFVEIWRAIDLGLSAYAQYWSNYLHFIHTYGVGPNFWSAPRTVLEQRSEVLWSSFHLSTYTLILSLLLGYFLVNSHEHRRLYLYLTALFAILAGYWLVFSIGWPRYFIFALVPYLFLMVVPLMRGVATPNHGLYLVALFCFSAAGWKRIDYPFRAVKHQWFAPADRTVAMLEAKQFIQDHADLIEKPLVTECWQTAADLEFLLPDSLNFTSYQDPRLQTRETYWIAANMNFSQKQPEFLALLATAEEKHEFGPYLIARIQDPTTAKRPNP